jgi:integrase/recombinase XerD
MSRSAVRRPRKELPYAEWPIDIRGRWEAAFAQGDFLDERGPGAHLAEKTRAALRSAYGRYLNFVRATHSGFIELAPEKQVSPSELIKYVAYRRGSCVERTVVIELHHLRLALRLVYPSVDWGWLLAATKRIATKAGATAERHHLVTSERLYALGFELMDHAMETSSVAGSVSKAGPLEYRDGLMIALLAAIPLRRRTFAALQIEKQLIKSGELWALDIPGEDTKTGRPAEFAIPAALSARVDLYIERFRPRIPAASKHKGLWASNKGRAMDGGAIYDAIRARTNMALGFAVNMHRFRHAAATFWSIQDPMNVRGAKDLLGHISFGTTETHYIMAQSRIAGRALASAVEGAMKN